MKTIIELIEAFCIENGHTFCEQYVKDCVAIQTSKIPVNVIIQLCDYLHKQGYDSVESVIGHAGIQPDHSFGNFIYFPSVRIPKRAQKTVKRCSDCDYWKDRNDNDYGTCTCEGESEYGCRTIGFHVCCNIKL